MSTDVTPVVAPDPNGSMDRLVNLLGTVRNKGARLWSQDGQLRYSAPSGALTREEMDELRGHKDQIVSLLTRVTAERSAGSERAPRTRLQHVPLAFSQLAHWNLFQLSDQASYSIVPAILRLQGRLNVEALKNSVAAIVSRHDALRTRIVISDGIPMQDIAAPGGFELPVEYLSAAAEDQLQRYLQEYIVQPMRVTSDPLFRARLVQIREDDHVLILVMDHIVSDGFSSNVLLRELLTAYVQADAGQPITLPEVPCQFADYAVQQYDQLKSWAEKHESYWQKHLKGAQRLRFPVSDDALIKRKSGAGTVPVPIDTALTARLRELCRSRGMTLVLGVFCAYVAFVLRWCDAAEAVFPFETNGRFSAETEHAIGYFAVPLYLKLNLTDTDRFTDLLQRVRQEYVNAFEHADFSYLESRVPRPEFARNGSFNWVEQGLKSGVAHSNQLGEALTCSRIYLQIQSHEGGPEMDFEPCIHFHTRDEDIVGLVQFSLGRHSLASMENFAREFVQSLEALQQQPDARIKDILRARNAPPLSNGAPEPVAQTSWA